MAPRGLNPPRSDQPISRTYHVGRRVWPPNVGSDPGVVALVEELHRRAIRVTRMAFNPDLWGPALRRLDADGRTIRLGWFRDLDRQLLNVTGELSRGRLDFLMVPRTRRRPPQSMPSRRPPTVPTGRHRPSCSTCSAPQVRPGGRGPLRRGLFLVWPASRSQSAIERSGADGEPASPEHHSDRE